MTHYDDLVGRASQRGFLTDTDDTEIIELRTEVGDLHDFAKVLADKLHELIDTVQKQQAEIEAQRSLIDRLRLH